MCCDADLLCSRDGLPCESIYDDSTNPLRGGSEQNLFSFSLSNSYIIISFTFFS
ncbi:hypothetical protein LguiA_015296 [Lonicera macranthoides]